MVTTKFYGELNAYMVGHKTRNEALRTFVKGIFDNFSKNCKSIVVSYMDHGHWSLCMYEDMVTLHCDFVDGFHTRGNIPSPYMGYVG